MKDSSVLTESFHGYQAASLIFSDKSFGVKVGRREIWTSKSFDVSRDDKFLKSTMHVTD